MNATTPAAGEQSEDDSEDIETKIADLPADEASNRLRRRLLLARFWRSARGFWRPPRGDRLAWLLTATIFNDAMAEMQNDSGGRLVPMAALPW